MARKKKTITDQEYVSGDYTEIENVSNQELPKAYNILTQEEEPKREKVIALREKGYNNNQIASMLNMHKQTIDKIK
jgi:IS30 family transposase